jgi:hypothetical protein
VEKEMPALAEKLDVKILATYVPMTNHVVFVAIEADDADAVRELTIQGRLGQWISTVGMSRSVGTATP